MAGAVSACAQSHRETDTCTIVWSNGKEDGLFQVRCGKPYPEVMRAPCCLLILPQAGLGMSLGGEAVVKDDRHCMPVDEDQHSRVRPIVKIPLPRVGVRIKSVTCSGGMLLRDRLSALVVGTVGTHLRLRSYFAITYDGELYSWGHGHDGQLGHGQCSDVLYPRRVDALLGQRVVQVRCC